MGRELDPSGPWEITSMSVIPPIGPSGPVPPGGGSGPSDPVPPGRPSDSLDPPGAAARIAEILDKSKDFVASVPDLVKILEDVRDRSAVRSK